MQSKSRARLEALEKAAKPKRTGIVQVVIYNPTTGEPLTPLDPSACRYIWMVDDGRGLQRPQR